MNPPKTFMLLLSFSLMYFVACGGAQALSQGTALLDLLAVPFTRGNMLDFVLLTMAVIGLAYVSAVSSGSEKVTYPTVLRSVGVGSALLSGVILATLMSDLTLQMTSAQVGNLGVAVLCQAFLGILAGCLLLLIPGKVRMGLMPVMMNGAVAAVVSCMLFFPVS